jgi:hypothetical protein
MKSGSMLLFRNLSLVIMITCIASCGGDEKDPDPRSIPVITSIQPGAGIAGMEVTITGTDFGTNMADINISFNGIEANIVSATETELVVEVPDNGTTGNVSVNIDGEEAVGPSFRYYEIFLLTHRSFHSLMVWKNGTLLSEITGNIEGSALKLVESDIYVSGMVYTDYGGWMTSSPAYWKNGLLTTLSEQGGTSDIHVTGADVYVSGSIPPGTRGVYWKNGALEELTDGTYPYSDPKTIEVIDGDVYVGGSIISDGHSDAVYWKNGEITHLTYGSESVALNDLKFSGTDIYAVGTEGVSSDGVPDKIVYWKNGVADELTDESHVASATSLDVNGTDIFVSGYEYTDNGIHQGTIWKNKTPVRLTDGVTYGNVRRVEVVGEDLITCGIRKVGERFLVYFAINDVIFPIEYDLGQDIVDMVVR